MQRRRTPMEIQQEIEQLFEESLGPKEIQHKLVLQFRERAPGLRTVQSIVSELRQRDTSGTWTVAEADPDEIAQVLPVLRAVAEQTNGRIITMTNDRARWVLRVHATAPSLPPWSVYRFAQHYGLQAADGETTTALDAVLVLAPWQSEPARARFLDGVSSGDLDPGLLGTAWLLLAPSALPKPRLSHTEAFQLEDEQLRNLWLFAHEAQDVIDSAEARAGEAEGSPEPEEGPGPPDETQHAPGASTVTPRGETR